MPYSKRAITDAVLNALIECFEITVGLVSLEVRHQLILIGGAASIVHGGDSILKTWISPAHPAYSSVY
jgi:hypothetical protein